MSAKKPNLRRVQSAALHTRDVQAIIAATGNLYESISVISRRSRQISTETKEELNQKISEFNVGTDSLEEIFENKEQIEVSRSYERMPKSTSLATDELMEGKLFYRYRQSEDDKPSI